SGSGSVRDYSSQLGINGELSIERHIKNGLEVSAGLQFSATRFSVDEVFDDTGILTSINETQTWIKVPVLARYNVFYEDKSKPILPYAFGGASINFLIDARFADSERQGGTQRSINGYDLLANNERKSINYSLFFGGGAKIRSNRVHFFTIEARYEIGLLNYVNSENRFVSNASINGLAYVPDNLSLNFLSFSLGYTHSIYNPKKKRKVNK
ncbi:MAG: porin family protein, partial [Bacteroidota bacterium]